jgi:hypothetical protein
LTMLTKGKRGTVNVGFERLSEDGRLE